MDATGTDRAVLVALSRGAAWSVHVAAEHPERVLGLFAMAPACGFAGAVAARDPHPWHERTAGDRRAGRSTTGTTGSRAATTTSWSSSSTRCSPSRTRPSRSRTASAGGARPIPAPWSTPPPGEMGLRRGAPYADRAGAARGSGARCSCCTATTTRSVRTRTAERLAELTGGSPGPARRGRSRPACRAHPVRVNLMIREFVGPDPPAGRAERRGWPRPRRRQRALYLSSPIGLGHARRDLAIVEELRKLHPDLRDRLARPAPGDPRARGRRRARPPGVGVAGERVGARRGRGRRARPARLPGDPADGRDPGQQLHGVRRGRRREHYDLVIGDEAWDVDHFLHENPELKRVRVRLADRLRRLAADAGRRRPARRR